MAYLDLYTFAVAFVPPNVLIRYKSTDIVPRHEHITWRNSEALCGIVDAPFDGRIWTPRNTSQDVHVLIEERVGLVWVSNYVATPVCLRIRQREKREIFLEGLKAFANPNRYTVEIEP